MPANSGVDVDINSTPLRLATLRSNASGAFSGTVTIPESVQPGAHTMVATSGNVSVSFPIVVLPRAIIPDTR
jgi:hypothetical protein